MKRALIIVGAVLALLLLAVAGAAWWLLDAEKMDPPSLAGSVEKGFLLHGGHTRTWQAYIPSYKSGPAPVVLVLHGSKGDGQRILEATRYGFNVLAEQYGFIPVYPDGFEQHWNDCRAGASYSANQQDIDDVGFLKSVVRVLAAGHDIDESRIYAAGMSNGGQMAYRLGLEAPHWVAGIAAIAASLPIDDNFDCRRAGKPVATLVINGNEDPINPYEGGIVEISGDASRGLVLSSEANALYWARLAGYRDEGEVREWPDTSPHDRTSITSRHWAESGKPPVTLVTVVGGGHTIPHPRYRLPRILGRTSHAFDAADLIWSFFSGRQYLPD